MLIAFVLVILFVLIGFNAVNCLEDGCGDICMDGSVFKRTIVNKAAFPRTALFVPHELQHQVWARLKQVCGFVKGGSVRYLGRKWCHGYVSFATVFLAGFLPNRRCRVYQVYQRGWTRWTPAQKTTRTSYAGLAKSGVGDALHSRQRMTQGVHCFVFSCPNYSTG